MYTGIGFMYEGILEEVKTDILAGKYGTAAENALRNNPEAQVEYEERIYECPDCGNVENKKSIIIYLPEGKKIKIKYSCEKGCKGFMRMMKKKPESMKCPECNGTLQINWDDMCHWD